MASVILGTVGAAVGAGIPVVGPVIGASFGRVLGASAGGMFDNALLGGGTTHREGSRLADLSVQVSSYGRSIPFIAGTARIAGNLIWSRPIKETATSTTSSAGGGKGGGGAKSETTTYSYSATLAVGLCEGPIDGVIRVWADTKLLDLSQGSYRVYTGSETQLPDPLIQSFEGATSTPGYRGLAYVVIEDFPLAEFGNRIPNFTFEVKRRMQSADWGGQITENRIKSMIMIPGAGEFVYDTSIQYNVPGEAVGSDWAQGGGKVAINMHNPRGLANSVDSLDQLLETCPNLEWVGVVATWFGTSLAAGACEVWPGVEYKVGAKTEPEQWSVGSYTRSTARQITLVDGSPRYGGTPDDQSLIRYCDAIRARGLKVFFIPMFFMDVAEKPWRGRVTGSAAEVASFFTKAHGYNAMVLHYAGALAGHVDGFAIGSELVGLTSVTSGPGVYPGVSALVSLAASARALLGAGVKLTYAADWSEYHHTTGGWYNLDPLWASANIDFIGIDAYFPLTDAPQDDYDVQDVIDGWTSGEGYDFVYTDSARTTTAALQAKYAWKNLSWFWSSPHVNPNSATTAWVPGSKKIWFTEYGFPSVDGATNQPNVFYDPTSSESYFPRFSRGMVDFRAQRLGITATEAKWAGSAMVERQFLWTWDARPYPYFPDLLNVWADGGVWATGHWTTGKLGLSSLAAVVRYLCLKAGLVDAQIDVGALTQRVQGYVVSSQSTARALIEELMEAYFFDAVESNGVLRFVPRGGEAVAALALDDVVAEEQQPLISITRAQELDLPREVSVLYLSRTAQYQTGTQKAARAVTSSRASETLNLPLVFTDAEARAIADQTLYQRWTARTSLRFYLGNAHAALEPADIVTLDDGNGEYSLRIQQILRDGGRFRVDAVVEDPAVYRASVPAADATPGLSSAPAVLPETWLAMLDLPAFPGDDPESAGWRVAAAGLAESWRGAVLYRSDDGGANYGRVLDIAQACVLGTAIDALPDFTGGNRFDEASTLTVRLLGDAGLESVTLLALMNGANGALVGEEIIQFRSAVELSEGRYQLSGLLRGRFGSEDRIAGHVAGERFVLLDGRLARENVAPSAIGLARKYKAVTFGGSLSSAAELDFTYTGRALKPYAPVLLTGSRDGSGNLTIGWTRRSRFGSWQDGVDVPLAEKSEAYTVEILGSGSVIRTLGSTTPQASYSATQQVADFGSLQASVAIRVYQLSERVGRGIAASASV